MSAFNFLAIRIGFPTLEILVALVYHVVEQQIDIPIGYSNAFGDCYNKPTLKKR